jgi:signal transduction histidine kinase
MNNAAGTVPIRVGQIRELLDPMDPNHGMISRYLDRIEQDAERILETARAIGGTVNVDKDSLEASDLNLLLTTALAHVECPPGLDIELDMTVDLPEVRVLSSDMVSVLENIIRNGIEAEPHHGPMNMRSYQLHRTGKEMVAVDISDRGCGIAQENLERVFEIGWSTKPGSMGFALYRAKNLIESWGGMIGIRSELNKGSTFTIQLPAFREEMV